MDNQIKIGDQNTQRIEQGPIGQQPSVLKRPKVTYWMIPTLLLLLIVFIGKVLISNFYNKNALRLITINSTNPPIMKALLRKTFTSYSIVDLSNEKTLRSISMVNSAPAITFVGSKSPELIDKYVEIYSFNLGSGYGGTLFIQSRGYFLNIKPITERSKFLISKYYPNSTNDSFFTIEIPKCDRGFDILGEEKTSSFTLAFACVKEDHSGVNVKFYNEYRLFNVDEFRDLGNTERELGQQLADYQPLFPQYKGLKSYQYINTDKDGMDEFQYGNIKIKQINHFKGSSDFDYSSWSDFEVEIQKNGKQIFWQKKRNVPLIQFAFDIEFNHLYLLFGNNQLISLEVK